jgi:sugar lactone lactonase YvrE
MKKSTWSQGLATLAACALMLPAIGHAKDTPGRSRNGHGCTSFPEFIPLNAPLGEYPEGVAVDKAGNVFLSIGATTGPRGAILKITPSLEKSVLVDFGTPGALGLAVDADGDVYVARSIAPNNGVYRVDRHGRAVRLPGTEQIVFPNALAFDHRGNLYVTETFSFDPPLVPYEHGFAPEFGRGGIWKVPRRGAARLWLRDDLLTGLGPTLFPFPVGANGIAFYHGDLYVINTDQALVVRVPVCPNGQPGQPEVWKQVEDVPESIFYQNPFIPLMLDGLALDVHGNVCIAVPSRGAIVRINADDLSQETLAAFPGSPLLDAPLSLAFGTAKGERSSLFISNGGLSEGIVPGLPWAGPGLLKIQVGIPGLPLP